MFFLFFRYHGSFGHVNSTKKKVTGWTKLVRGRFKMVEAVSNAPAYQCLDMFRCPSVPVILLMAEILPTWDV